jgi:hypothetical protein
MNYLIRLRKYIKFPLSIFILCAFQFNGNSQSSEELTTTALHRIIIEKTDTVYRFYVTKPDMNLMASTDLTYFWYKPDTILQTHGGYDGFLLNGLYAVFFPNKNLMEKGSFVNGLKVGEWRSWYPNGKLESVFHWKGGMRQGQFIVYSEKSDIIRSGSYKNDLLEGSVFEMSSDNKLEKKEYKKGTIKVEKKENVEDSTIDNNN